MKHFPKPLKVPETVPHEREMRNVNITRSAVRGIIIRSAIILFELFGVAVFGSSALLLDAISSLVDVASTVFLIVCIRLAERPPDRNHPFGHGRFEPLAGLLLGLLLVIIGLGLLVQQSLQLATLSSTPELDKRAWFIPFCALIMLEFCYRKIMYTAKKEHSPALAADAIHYRIDALTSLLATISLLAAAYFPSWSHTIDHTGALLIALFMIIIGIYATKGNINQILDRTPEEKYFTKVRQAARLVDGVRETEKIRIQQYGPDAHINIDIEVDPDLSVEVAHKITQKVRFEIQKAWPAVRDVIVHVEPYYPNDHANKR
jgi:cation diffusion facilitator family transporter